MRARDVYKIYILLIVLLSILLLYCSRTRYLSWDHYLSSEFQMSCSNGTRRLLDPPSVILSPPYNFCHSKQYLIIVVTRVSEPSVRQSFRNTYGRLGKKYDFTVVFPLGLSADKNINMDVEEERRRFGDILQTDFIDNYCNLTLKTYSYSNYVRHNCTNVRAVLKVDDDLAWNVEQMFDYLSKIDTTGNILYCRSLKDPPPYRDRRERWYVSKEEYPHKFFPEHCLSPVYAASPSTIAQLAYATNTIPHVWLDDVWSLGIVAREIGAKFQSLSFNSERKIFEPFLNGSVITQYFQAKDDGLTLFNLMTRFVNEHARHVPMLLKTGFDALQPVFSFIKPNKSTWHCVET